MTGRSLKQRFGLYATIDPGNSGVGVTNVKRTPVCPGPALFLQRTSIWSVGPRLPVHTLF
ncbi:MAG: hypothetical protein WDM78_20145 [Puia sp.]